MLFTHHASCIHLVHKGEDIHTHINNVNMVPGCQFGAVSAIFLVRMWNEGTNQLYCCPCYSHIRPIGEGRGELEAVCAPCTGLNLLSV